MSQRGGTNQWNQRLLSLLGYPQPSVAHSWVSTRGLHSADPWIHSSPGRPMRCVAPSLLSAGAHRQQKQNCSASANHRSEPMLLWTGFSSHNAQRRVAGGSILYVQGLRFRPQWKQDSTPTGAFLCICVKVYLHLQHPSPKSGNVNSLNPRNQLRMKKIPFVPEFSPFPGKFTTPLRSSRCYNSNPEISPSLIKLQQQWSHSAPGVKKTMLQWELWSTTTRGIYRFFFFDRPPEPKCHTTLHSGSASGAHTC